MILCHHTVGGGGGGQCHGGGGGGHCHGNWTSSSNLPTSLSERSLTGSEKAAAQGALAKLVGSGSAQFFSSESARAGTQLQINHSLANGLISGQGTDSFAGGAVGGHVTLPTFVSDSVGGGAMAKSAASAETFAGFRTGGEAVKIAGASAAGVKAEQLVSGSHSAVMSDHTVINLTGVHTNALVKPTTH